MTISVSGSTVTFSDSSSQNTAFTGSATTATNLAGGSNGTIPYQSASGTTQMLAAGTSGQVLTSAGSSSAPTWTTPSAGAMVLISTISLTGQTSVSWTGINSYTKWLLIVNDANNATSTDVAAIQIGYGATPTYVTSGYAYQRIYGSNTAANASTFSGLSYMFANYSATSGPSEGQVLISSSNGGVSALSTFGSISPFAGVEYNWYATATTVTALKLYIASGYTFSSGTASLYGISS
jgi:hypothetical protein